MKIKYLWKTFKELSTDDLYAILNLRQKVFVMEQDCPYIDADYSDQEAFHLLGYDEKNILKAYLRAFSPNIKYKGASMGRIVVEEGMRNKSIGKEITNIGVQNQMWKWLHTFGVQSQQFERLWLKQVKQILLPI